jgi:hypothetical protein
MSPENSREKQVNDELRLLYTSCVSEIAGFKQQQWQVTNYVVLLFAAVASVPKIITNLAQLEFFLLYVAAFAVLSAGWYVLGLFSASIQVRRCRLTEIRTKHFTDEFRSAWRYGRTEAEVPDAPAEKTNLVWFFRAVFVVGFATVCWLLSRYACAA